MLHIEKWKIVVALILTFLGIAYAVPNVLPPAVQEKLATSMPAWFPSSTINLGLDLQGGSHLLLEADTKKPLGERFISMRDSARSELRKEKIRATGFDVTRDGITFKLVDAEKDRAGALRAVRNLEENTVVDIQDNGTVTVSFTEAGIRDINSKIINQAIETVRRRVDAAGTREPVIQRQGDNRIVVQLPGLEDPSYIKSLLGQTAQMSFHLVDLDATRAGPSSMQLPFVEDGSGMGGELVVQKRSLITGDMLIDSQPTFQDNSPVVSFRFNKEGAQRFCTATRDNIGRLFAIVLDDKIISAPRINDAICGGSGIISGSFTVKEATDLALLLRAGALPAPLEIVEERSVGPTLGSDSIAAGKHAAVVAFVLVFALMAFTYGLFGLFANLALLLNIIFILSVLSILQATLTLPGIAGIILTIGIAVDANVLIYERIREEIRQGRSVLSSIDTGYRLALNTIVDSNLTTLIVAIILFSFGSGPIKGFAVTMCIGIVTSMFSAIMLTRMMVLAWVRRNKPATLAL